MTRAAGWGELVNSFSSVWTGEAIKGHACGV